MDTTWYILAAVGLTLAIGIRVGLGVAARATRRRIRRASRLGETGMRRAERLLRRRGFEILDDEVAGEIIARVDGVEHRFPVRADLLARRAGRQYVIEVKRGARAPSITQRATRRQLLEYSLAFDADAVLLLDAESDRLITVEFPPSRPRRGR